VGEIGLNYEEIYDQVPETAAILDAILNFSKCSRVTSSPGRFWKWAT